MIDDEDDLLDKMRADYTKPLIKEMNSTLLHSLLNEKIC